MTYTPSYRPLHESEIKQLIQQGCSSTTWNTIEVVSDFLPEHIHNVRFSGSIQLGKFAKTFTLPGGVPTPSGLYNCTLHNCSIADNVLIENIAQYIANYTIGENTRIQNVKRIYVSSTSTFGNGVEVAVLNEVGGREVPIFNEMSAQFAYIVALYRHNTPLISCLTNMVQEYALRQASDRGHIGENVTITGCGNIENVCIRPFALLDGVQLLRNGSVNSNQEAPIYIGNGVIAEDFILSSGSHIDTGSNLTKTFVGQACNISKLFSSHDSLFFSNCQCENGEASAVFAGPYTVSMHKSSLLIAGMFSFLNAGSGSNQSNHLYKLGPIHQGIVERGSKTTSDSYILWPAKIGAFSLIMGRHVEHPDTSNFPFSYLIEQNNHTFLVPAVNIRSVGTIRDAKKWPNRDKRKDSIKLDKINFNLLSPFTIQKMLTALDTLRLIRNICGETTSEYYYNNVHIRSSALAKGIHLYSMAIIKFLGNSLISRIKDKKIRTNAELREVLTPTNPDGKGEWIDLSGLIAPKNAIDRLLEDVVKQRITTIAQIESTFTSLFDAYYDMEWTWAWQEIVKWFKINPDEITIDQVISIIEEWRLAVVALDNRLYEDAKKEFSLASKVSFGMDGTKKRAEKDFECVRGDFENNPFVKTVEQHIEEKSRLAELIINQLRHV